MSVAEKALLTIISDKIRTNTLVLPTLPEIAIQIRKKSFDPTASLRDMAEIIGNDPALAARMIRVANSAFMGRSIKINTLNQAVTRIGLGQIRNITMAMAMEQLFISQYKQVQQHLNAIWKLSVDITSIAVACLKYYNAHHKHTGLSTDVLALAALVHNIGALPVLTEAERHEEILGHPLFLERLIDKVSPVIGMHILDAWEFTEEFKVVMRDWRDTTADAEVSYTDFIRLAAIHRKLYADQDQAKQLLEYYVERNLVPVSDFMQEQDIASVYQDVRSLFS